MSKRAWDTSKRGWDILACSREQFQVLRNSVEICKFLSKCAPNMSKRAWDTSKRAWDMLKCSREHFQVLRNSVEICKFVQNVRRKCQKADGTSQKVDRKRKKDPRNKIKV